ncbi:hypothetical protein JHK82_044620 [Glycine max]|uniref:ZF-HD dimerization-type domain-containing protein n=1 Tax=Glycine max TaxID=3847 RepID=A0A0R0FW91_SOYBN|nr:hypothetical protein JHK86_045022 [Glycine max]KAG4940941.1 hypothetical protein JHK87_044812 [Glycine soja]KAG4951723.1 hypothetical protein JHK85_045590 [Glycine max]KAG5099568.1 hypothetical protein JHK82_044620 [Glycine max]KAG5108170.1 hypothetical protein JHK84_045077 [Glycine max]
MSFGGHAANDCCEFLAAREDDTLETVICVACNYHRNFHCKEIDDEITSIHHRHNPLVLLAIASDGSLSHEEELAWSSQRVVQPTTSYTSLFSENDKQTKFCRTNRNRNHYLLIFECC